MQRGLLGILICRYCQGANIVICGMGGSAIGGDLLKAYLSGSVEVPMEVVRNYSLPRYVDQNTW